MKLLKLSYQAGARLARACPPGVRYPVAAFGGAAWYTLSPSRRRAALSNYAAVLGLPEDHPEVRRVMRQACANYGRMLADFLLMGSLKREEVDARMTLDGIHHVDEALGEGRGAILALPHMGSWDFAGSIAGILGYRIVAVVERFPGSLNEAVVETRTAHGLQVVPLGRSAVRAINRALDDNGLVALACDLPHGPGVDVRFFGRRAVVPSGPAAIASRRGCALLPMYVRRSGPTTYHIHVDPPIARDAAEGAGGREATARLMQLVVDRFEGFIHEYPDQWYAFRRILH